MQQIFLKCPFKENGKLSELFHLVLRGLSLPAGSDTPQNKILRGIRPCRTRPCGVSDPPELGLAGIRPRRTMAELCTFYSIHLFCGVRYPAEQCPAGPDTPLNKVLQGIRPRGTKSCGVSNPMEQHLKTNISANSKKELKNILGCEFGDYMGSIRRKKPEVKNLLLLSL